MSETKTIPNDLEVMAEMAKANKDIAFYPDVLQAQRTKKGAKITVGVTDEAMQKLGRSYTETGPRYVAMLVVINYEEFEGTLAELKTREQP